MCIALCMCVCVGAGGRHLLVFKRKYNKFYIRLTNKSEICNSMAQDRKIRCSVSHQQFAHSIFFCSIFHLCVWRMYELCEKYVTHNGLTKGQASQQMHYLAIIKIRWSHEKDRITNFLYWLFLFASNGILFFSVLFVFSSVKEIDNSESASSIEEAKMVINHGDSGRIYFQTKANWRKTTILLPYKSDANFIVFFFCSASDFFFLGLR